MKRTLFYLLLALLELLRLSPTRYSARYWLI